MFFNDSQRMYDLICRETAMDNIENNLMHVDSNNGKTIHLGTGYLIDTKGYVITAGHIIDSAFKNGGWNICVTTRNDEPIDMNSIESHYFPLKDIAVLKIDGARQSMTCIKTGYPVIDDSVMLLGYDENSNLQKIPGTVKSANCNVRLYNTTKNSLELKNLFEIDVSCSVGMSGGVVIRDNQEILGTIVGTNEGHTYASKITDILPYINTHLSDL